MPCYEPTRVVTQEGHIDWKKDWRFPLGRDSRLNVPCRCCIGCRQGEARQWAIRSFHEAQGHVRQWRDPESGISAGVPNSSVITLTYNDEHLPKDGYLKHDDFQRFMMRLRKKRGSKDPVRYFMCGEYGGKNGRPHYHAILFGESFDDTYPVRGAGNKTNQMSHGLNDLWSQRLHPQDRPTNMGLATVDTFHFAAAAYVAGYVAKKLGLPHQTGPTVDVVDDVTGETRVGHPAPEYRQMSRRRGLGYAWITNKTNMDRTYRDDFIQIQEWKFHPPRFYDAIHKKKRPKSHARLLLKRAEGSDRSALEWDPDRCAAAQEIALSDLHLREDSI